MKTRKILAVILTIFTLAGVFNATVFAAGNTGNSNGLLNLEISEPTQNFTFNPFRYDYPDVVVLPITRTITIKPVAAAGVITVDGAVVASGSASNQILLESGGAPKMIRVVVTEDGKVPTVYTVAVTRRSPGVSNDLTDLVMSGAPENFLFAPGRYSYPNVTVSSTTLAVTFRPTAAAGVITVDSEVVTSGATSNQVLLEDVGIPKLINVIVTENGKEPKAYSITVKRRAPEQSNDLAWLEISGSPMGFAFSPTTYVYPDVTVATTAASITLRPYAAAGVITVDGVRVTSGSTSNAIRLSEIGAPRTVSVVVTESGKLPKNYVITVSRRYQALSNDLTGLVISASPANYIFSPTTYAYPDVTVATTATSITLRPTAAAGVITVDGVRVASGAISNAIVLAEIGVPKTVEVAVTEDGKLPKVYSVTVARRYPTSSNDLAWLEISGSPTGFAFSPTTYLYPNVTVATTAASITMRPFAAAGNITVDGMRVASGAISGQIWLPEIGVSKTVSIVVSEEGKTPAVYAVTLARRDPTPSGDLMNLEISGSPTGFTFSPTVYSYPNVTVPPTVFTVALRPTAAAGVITVDGVVVASGAESNQILLPSAIGTPRTIDVVVAEDGKLPKTYVITVTRRQPAPSNDLTDLVISGSPTGFAFSPATYVYPNVTVASNIYTITMRPTAAAGIITVDGANVASGAESNQILLPDIGDPRTIYVAVTESGKLTKTYIVTVTRRYATPAATGGGGSPGAGGVGASGALPAVANITEIIDGDPALGAANIHMQYINGYPEGDMRPDDFITRAETASVVYRLFGTQDGGAAETPFSDVAADEWYAQATAYLAQIGTLNGYPDGTFKPEAPVTRAELAAIISGFDGSERIEYTGFSDADGHWAAAYIDGAASKGWLTGYPDGTFRPEQALTRAEIVTVMNRMSDRRVKAADIPEWAPGYTDLPTTHWAYANIIEASVSHTFERADDGFEVWAAELGEAAQEP